MVVVKKILKQDNSGAYKVRLKPLTSYEIIAFKNEFLKISKLKPHMLLKMIKQYLWILN